MLYVCLKIDSAFLRNPELLLFNISNGPCEREDRKCLLLNPESLLSGVDKLVHITFSYEEDFRFQRHEEDFNLQNKTLLEEVSRVSLQSIHLLPCVFFSIHFRLFLLENSQCLCLLCHWIRSVRLTCRSKKGRLISSAFSSNPSCALMTYIYTHRCWYVWISLC